MNFVPGVWYVRILPEIVLTVFGALILLVEGPARAGNRGRLCGALALLGSLAAFAACFVQARYPGEAFSGLFRVDRLAIYFHFLIVLATLVVVLLAMDYLRAQHYERGEFYALVLFAAVGMGFMVGSVELVMIFIGLEISSISSYILAGYRRNAPRSTEAALKYLLLGSFATAFFLYGIALIYGGTGSTMIDAIARGVAGKISMGGLTGASLIPAAAGLMFVGLAFKVSAVPFQVWTPDVYEGAPAPVTGLLATAPKAAAFVVFLRVFYVALNSYSHDWFWLVWTASLLSMTAGNLAALLQNNIKRMLAYSSIAHAGYVLVAFAALAVNPTVLQSVSGPAALLPGHGVAAILFYLAAYVAMNLGAFAVIAHFAHRNERYVELNDYAGLGFRFPFASAALALFLLSLIGVPLTAGFFGKLYVFRAALDAHLVGLVIVALLNSALAAFYYLRVIVYMYMRPSGQEVPAPAPSGAFRLVMAICIIAVLWLGIFPETILGFAHAAAYHLR